jgi:hypothetical protein
MSDIDIELINLTSHAVDVGRESVEPSGSTARIYYEQNFDHHVNGLPTYRNINGWVKGLPKPQKGIGYIVSGIVFQSILRPDLYTPNTQPWSVIHKEHGQAVKSVRSLICMPRVIA